MKKILHSNTLLLLLMIVLSGYCINFISLDVVMNDSVLQKHLNEKYEKKYNEFKDLDIDLSEFEDELKEFEQNSEEDNSYGWDYFYVDTIAIMVPIGVMVLGFSCVLLLFFLFHKSLNIISYLDILKASIIAYFIFYIPDIISNTYFLIVNTDYTVEDIQNFNRFFQTTSLFKQEELAPWLWTLISDFNWIYILFPIAIALCLKVLYKQFSLLLLLFYSFVAYISAFIFCEIIMWYIYGF